jgi:membrane protein
LPRTTSLLRFPIRTPGKRRADELYFASLQLAVKWGSFRAKTFGMFEAALKTELQRLPRLRIARAQLAETLRSSAQYLFETEVHAYAFSIAANAYLSFFPFTLILLAICRRWLHWNRAYMTIIQLLQVQLPQGSESVIHNLVLVAQGRPRLQVVSVLMLFFTSSGVFVPLEIALNKVWGFRSNRNFLKNQVMSFLLALVSGLLALLFILAMTPLQSAISFSLGWIPSVQFVRWVSNAFLGIASVPLVITIYFLIYYLLPNGKVPVLRVLPAAIAAGILTEVGSAIYSLTHPMVHFRAVYGPFALSVTLLFWAYAGAMILLFGAHLSAHGFVLNGSAQAVPEPSDTELEAG